jgi:hypothetical protein
MPIVSSDEEPEIVFEPSQLAGVWANRFLISPSEHEFTLDFFRVDASVPDPGRAVLVARIAFSPLLASALIDKLMEEWQWYARKELLPEGEGDERLGPQDPQE